MTVNETNQEPTSDIEDEVKTPIQSSTKPAEPANAERAQFFDPEGFPAIHRSLSRLTESLRSDRENAYVYSLLLCFSSTLTWDVLSTLSHLSILPPPFFQQYLYHYRHDTNIGPSVTRQASHFSYHDPINPIHESPDNDSVSTSELTLTNVNVGDGSFDFEQFLKNLVRKCVVSHFPCASLLIGFWQAREIRRDAPPRTWCTLPQPSRLGLILAVSWIIATTTLRLVYLRARVPAF